METLLWADDELNDHPDDVAAAVVNADAQGVELVPLTTRGTGLTDDHVRFILSHVKKSDWTAAVPHTWKAWRTPSAPPTSTCRSTSTST